MTPPLRTGQCCRPAPFCSPVLCRLPCEKLLYRGAILRPVHDAIARRGSIVLAAVISSWQPRHPFTAPSGRLTHRARGRRLHDHRHRVWPGLRAHRLDDRGHGLALSAELLRLRADPGPGTWGRTGFADPVHPGLRLPGDCVLRCSRAADRLAPPVITGRRSPLGPVVLRTPSSCPHTFPGYNPSAMVGTASMLPHDPGLTWSAPMKMRRSSATAFTSGKCSFR